MPVNTIPTLLSWKIWYKVFFTIQTSTRMTGATAAGSTSWTSGCGATAGADWTQAYDIICQIIDYIMYDIICRNYDIIVMISWSISWPMISWSISYLCFLEPCNARALGQPLLASLNSYVHITQKGNFKSSQLWAFGNAAGLVGKALAWLPKGLGFESVHPLHYEWCFTFFPEQIIFFIRTMIS